MEDDESVVNKSRDEPSGDPGQVKASEEKLSSPVEKKSALLSTWSSRWGRDNNENKNNVEALTKSTVSEEECKRLKDKITASVEKTHPSSNVNQADADPEKNEVTPSPDKIVLRPSKLDFVVSPRPNPKCGAIFHNPSSSRTVQIDSPNDICKLQADEAALNENVKSSITQPISGVQMKTEILDHTTVPTAPEKLTTFRERYAARQKIEKAQLSNKADTIVTETEKLPSGLSEAEDLNKGASVNSCQENSLLIGSKQHHNEFMSTGSILDLVVEPESLKHEIEDTNGIKESSSMLSYDRNTCSQHVSSIPDYSLYCSNVNKHNSVHEDGQAPNSENLCTSSLNNPSLSTSPKPSSVDGISTGLSQMLLRDNNNCNKNNSLLPSSTSNCLQLEVYKLNSKRELDLAPNYEDHGPLSRVTTCPTGTDTPINLPSETSDNQDWIEMVSQKLNKLQISQVVGGTSDEVLSVEISSISNPFFRIHIKSALKTIWNQVQQVESIFKEATCLPDNLMNTRLKLFQDSKVSISKRLPQEIYKSFMSVFDKFTDEYKERNQEIHRLESELMGTLMDKAVQYYSDEMKFVLGETFVDANTFHSFRREIHQETERIFLEAAGLKHYECVTTYKTELSNGLRIETEKLEKQNETKKEEEDEKLKSIVKDCVQKYKSLIDEGKQVRQFCPQQFAALSVYNNIAREANKETFDYFHQQTDTLGLTQNAISYAEDLDKELGLLVASELNKIEIIQNELKKTEEASKYHQQQFAKTSGNPMASTSTFQLIPEVLNQGMQTGSFPDERLSNVLPQRDLVVHFGCERTLAGIVLPDSGDIFVLYDVKNSINFGKYELLLSLDDYESYSRLQIPNLIDRHQTTPLYDVYSPKYGQRLRLEELIACLLLGLKWRTELEHQVEIAGCSICVPQSFNYCHRKVVEDAARIARLENVTFINDTQAIALAFMMKEEQRNASVVVVNISEGFMDCAYFKLENAVFACHGVNGDYFHEKDCGFRKTVVKTAKKIWDEDTYMKKKILNSLEELMQNLKKSDDSKRSASYMILCGNDADFRRWIVEVVNEHLGEIPLRLVNHEYPLMGTGYYTGLATSKSYHAFYKRWMGLCGGDCEDLEIFLSQIKDQRRKDEKLSIAASKLCRYNLSAGHLLTLDRTFVLHDRRQLHFGKLEVLKKLLHLKECVENSNISYDGEAGVISRCNMIRYELLTQVTAVALTNFHHELNHFFKHCFPEFY